MTLQEKKRELIADIMCGWKDGLTTVSEGELERFADALLEEVAKTVDVWEIPLEKMNMRSRGDIVRNKLVDELASAIRSGKGK